MTPSPRTKAAQRTRSGARTSPRAPSRISLPYNVTVADVMSRSTISIGEDASLYDALVLMRTNRVTGLPVVDKDGALSGVISERDLARILGLPTEPVGTEGLLDVLVSNSTALGSLTVDEMRDRLEEGKVIEVMSRPPISTHSDAPVELAMEVMAENDIHRLPVVEGNRLVGIVSTSDLLRSVLRTARGG
jgi:CBS domain-containing protein